jgi:hypothetical protein
MAKPWVFYWASFMNQPNRSKVIASLNNNPSNPFMIITFIRSNMKKYEQQLVHHTEY